MLYDRTLFTALLAGLQTLALLALCCRCWDTRRPVRLRWISFAALSALIGAAVYALCRLVSDSHMTWSFLYTLGLQIPLCAWLFQGSLRQKCLYIVFTNVLYSISLLLSLMVSVLLLPRLGPHVGTARLGTMMNLLFQLLTLGILMAIRRPADPRGLTILPPAPYWICIFTLYGLIYAGSVYVSDTLIGSRLVTAVTPVIETALLAVSVVVYLMFVRVCQGYSEHWQHTLAEKQMALQRAHLDDMRASGDAMRQLRHELKNHMFYMQYLIDKKDFDGLSRYFREFYQKESRHLVEVDASGSVLNAVLHQKLSVAGQKGIQIVDDLHCAPPKEIDEKDLCLLLSNLLDNAIEASEGLQNAVITVHMRLVKEYLSLVVSNTVDRDVLRENPGLSTDKPHREIHGIGLRVIREIVDRYDGSVRFESGDGMFHAKLMLRIGGDET